MTTNVKVLRSTDAGAPVLSGQAGALIGVLDAVLVNGYGGGTLSSLTRSGSTATASLTSHGFVVGDCVLIAGANESEYNGEHYVATVPDANTFTFAVSGTPASPATGTVTVKKAPLGWSKAYSGTNLAAYRQGGGNLMYLRIDDTAAQSSRLVGYESMSDINTGSGPFPTAAQMSGGLYIYKSSAASSAARPWRVVGIDRLMFLYLDTDGAGVSNNNVHILGDIKSYKAGDAYGTFLAGNNTAAAGNCFGGQLAADPNSVASGHYVARSYTQLGTSLNVGKHTDAAKSRGASHIGTNGLTYPNPPDGGLYLAPVWIHEPGYIVRGEIPGFWCPLHTRPLNNLDTLSGTGDLAGKTFEAWNFNSGSQGAQVLIETSNTWSI